MKTFKLIVKYSGFIQMYIILIVLMSVFRFVYQDLFGNISFSIIILSFMLPSLLSIKEKLRFLLLLPIKRLEISNMLFYCFNINSLLLALNATLTNKIPLLFSVNITLSLILFTNISIVLLDKFKSRKKIQFLITLILSCLCMGSLYPIMEHSDSDLNILFLVVLAVLATVSFYFGKKSYYKFIRDLEV